MEKAKRNRLEANGWKIGTTAEFLNLSTEETEYIELKLSLSKTLQFTRRQKKMTQHQLAKLLKSSQSRVAKMEASDPSVSVDILIRSLIALGASRKTLAHAIS